MSAADSPLAGRDAALLAAIVESSDDAIMSTDLERRVTSWNSSAERLFGYAAAEIIGQPVALLVPDERRDEIAGALATTSAGGQVAHLETVRRHKDGRLVDVSVSLSPIRGPEGAVIGTGAVIRDVSERRDAELRDGRLAALVEASVDAIFTTGADGVIATWNRGAERLFGYTEAEAVGRHVSMVVPPERMQEHRDLMAEVTAGRAVSSLERVRLRSDGRLIEVSITVSPIVDASGALIAVSAIARDISDQKRIERARIDAVRDLEDAQQLAKVGSWTWDPSSDQATWSAQLYEIFGRDPSDGPAPHEAFLGYVHPEDREHVDAGYAQAFGSETFQIDDHYRILVDGSERAVHALGRADPERPGCYLGTVQDVSAERAAESERMRLAAERAQADSANRAKSEFLARMSHELRTPLNAIIGFGQLLELEPLDGVQRESVDYILKGGRHLLELVNEVLDIARIESGGLTISPEAVPLAELVRDAVALVTPTASEHKIRLVHDACVDGAGHVLADRNRLKQVLLNLLSNAIKYNRPAGSVTVSFAGSDDGRVRIAVADTGIGIRPEHLAKLFEPFERLGAERTAVEGTGLGLALSKGLIEAMGGTIAVDTEPGAGTTFTIDLAAADDPQRQDRATDRAEPVIGGPSDGAPAWRILYIEDNLSNLALIQRVLGRQPGVELLSAMQGSVGLELARNHHPDLIVLDLHLPDMSGADVLKRLRAEDPDTPVVVITADATKGQERALNRLGASEYLTKPLDIRRFLTVVTHYLDTAPQRQL